MTKLILFLFLGIIGYYGWQWLGPLPENLTGEYVEMCNRTLPDGGATCACAGKKLQRSSRRIALTGLWSDDILVQDQLQEKIARDHIVPCISEVLYAKKACMNDPATAYMGTRRDEYCSCLQAITVRQMTPAIKRGAAFSEKGVSRFAETVNAFMRESRQNAELVCRQKL